MSILAKSVRHALAIYGKDRLFSKGMYITVIFGVNKKAPPCGESRKYK